MFKSWLNLNHMKKYRESTQNSTNSDFKHFDFVSITAIFELWAGEQDIGRLDHLRYSIQKSLGKNSEKGFRTRRCVREPASRTLDARRVTGNGSRYEAQNPTRVASQYASLLDKKKRKEWNVGARNWALDLHGQVFNICGWTSNGWCEAPWRL